MKEHFCKPWPNEGHFPVVPTWNRCELCSQKWLGWSSYLLGVKICGLVPLRVLKCKMASVKSIVVPFRVLWRKIWEVNISQLNWYLLGVKNCSDHAHKTEFWYLLGVFSKISNDHLRHFFYGSPPPPGWLHQNKQEVLKIVTIIVFRLRLILVLSQVILILLISCCL